LFYYQPDSKHFDKIIFIDIIEFKSNISPKIFLIEHFINLNIRNFGSKLNNISLFFIRYLKFNYFVLSMYFK